MMSSPGEGSSYSREPAPSRAAVRFMVSRLLFADASAGPRRCDAHDPARFDQLRGSVPFHDAAPPSSAMNSRRSICGWPRLARENGACRTEVACNPRACRHRSADGRVTTSWPAWIACSPSEPFLQPRQTSHSGSSRRGQSADRRAAVQGSRRMTFMR